MVDEARSRRKKALTKSKLGLCMRSHPETEIKGGGLEMTSAKIGGGWSGVAVDADD
jgi:hypothetical protein